MSTIRPLHDRVIVRRIDETNVKTAGGLHIPDNAREKSQEGEVIAVGSGKILENGSRVPPDLKTGDRILFGKYAGTEVTLDGKDLLILREEDVLGVVARSAGAASSKTK
jgi:chaperonin GroES